MADHRFDIGSWRGPYYRDAQVVGPSDTTPLAVPCIALWVGTAGALKVTTVSGTTVTIPAVPAGEFRLQVSQVFATGTSASNILALYT
jgi:hypothetical protein